MVEEWSRKDREMVEPWWSTSEVVRDIGAIMERPPTFSHEVKAVFLGSFKIHFEVGVVEECSRNGRGMVEEWSSRFTSLMRLQEGTRLNFGVHLEHATKVEKTI